MGVARKWHFSISGDAANLGGVSGDLFEHRGSGIPLLGITSLNRHFYVSFKLSYYNEYKSYLRSHHNRAGLKLAWMSDELLKKAEGT